MRISHEAIYQALFIQGRGALKRDLVACLRTGRALRVPRARARQRRDGMVTPEVMISQRPAEADDRAVPGHWEGDLIIGLDRFAIDSRPESYGGIRRHADTVGRWGRPGATATWVRPSYTTARSRPWTPLPSIQLLYSTAGSAGGIAGNLSSLSRSSLRLDGVLRLAPRRSEHVALAGGRDVLAAGELMFTPTETGWRITEVTNQSTGYCPDPDSWPAVGRALDRLGVSNPGTFTDNVVFRRCPTCGERNIVRDNDFTCALCNGPLPTRWNFTSD
ncbi:hypothetical protein GCM10027280_05230 [Micromonospora polyrhachis]|uniref:Transposase n=1 Tax=Micromonospora polyrhachis TaxID=1282883 RepID=A0A7W7WMF7_9ACTN|nr:hypothetical protein [Micromonospora polyrhachis]